MRNILVAVLLAGCGLCSSTYAADLLRVYRDAAANDAAYASARAAFAAGQEKIVQGRAGLLPTVTLGGSYTDTSIEQLNRDFTSNTYTLSLNQPLFRWANWEQYQQGKLSAAISEAQFAQAGQDLALRVAQAYFDVLVAQHTLESILAQKQAISEQLAFAKKNFEVGTATITDTHEAQARFDLVVAQELAARNNLDIKRSALQQITGIPVGELAALRTDIELKGPQPEIIEPWLHSARSENYTVVAQELNLELARREVSRNRASHAPTLDLVASRSHSDRSITRDAATTTSSIGLQWNIPLFAGFATSSRVNEAIALQDKARADLQQARRTAEQAARQAYFGVTSGLAQVKALEAAEISSRSALEANQLGYQVGVRINIDVLNAQQQLFAARTELARARYETLLHTLRLKAAAGNLKDEDLVQINALLQPVPDKRQPAQ